MFLSYEHTKYLGYDNENNLYRWEYKIVDSVFEEVGDPGSDGKGYLIEVGKIIINTYEKRNLPVAINLVRAFIWVNKKYPSQSINTMIEYNKQHNPKFHKYEAEVNKYLMLV